jgi:hypothetical protein
MSRSSNHINAHERDRWLRHDAHLWIRHDIKRFLKPGTDPADVIPTLARQRDREEAAFAAQIAKGYRLIAALREEVASIRADMIRRRLAEQTKYSPTQPRVPAGEPRGGQWTDRSGGGSTISQGRRRPGTRARQEAVPARTVVSRRYPRSDFRRHSRQDATDW